MGEEVGTHLRTMIRYISCIHVLVFQRKTCLCLMNKPNSTSDILMYIILIKRKKNRRIEQKNWTLKIDKRSIKLTINYFLDYPILLWAICNLVNFLAFRWWEKNPFMANSCFMLKMCLLKIILWEHIIKFKLIIQFLKIFFKKTVTGAWKYIIYIKSFYTATGP